MWIINTEQCTTILLAVLVSFSCSRMRNDHEALRLEQWDLLCDSVPEAISDSLNTMNVQELLPANHARYGLLRTITDDKIHVPVTTDSLINSVENYFRHQEQESYSNSVDDRLNTQIQELEQRYELSEYENRTLKAETRFNFILTLSAFGILFSIMLFLYFRKQGVVARLKQTKLTEEKRDLEWEKREAEVKSKLLQERAELQRLLLSRYDLFLQFHTNQHQEFVRMGDKIRSKEPELGDAYDQMLKTGQKQFTSLVGELFTVDEIERLFNVVVEKNTFNESDRLLLFMLSTHATNEQIAALLNTTTHNLKTRKTYLKNKIIKKAITDTEFERLLKHF